MRAIDGDALMKRLGIAYDCRECDQNKSPYCTWKPDAVDVCQIISDAPTIEPERKTGIPKDAVEYILRKETVSTNPYNFTANEKFIKFMDDPEIASFGRWQHANGFNTALVAVKCELDKIPDDEPERKKGQWIFYETENERYDDIKCPFCKKTYTVDAYRIDDIGFTAEDFKFCPNCGAEMKASGKE